MRKRSVKYQPPTHFEYGWDDEQIAVPEWDRAPRKFRPYQPPRRRSRSLARVREASPTRKRLEWLYQRRRYQEWSSLSLRHIYDGVARGIFPKMPSLGVLNPATGGKTLWGGSMVYWDTVIAK